MRSPTPDLRPCLRPRSPASLPTVTPAPTQSRPQRVIDPTQNGRDKFHPEAGKERVWVGQTRGGPWGTVCGQWPEKRR